MSTPLSLDTRVFDAGLDKGRDQGRDKGSDKDPRPDADSQGSRPRNVLAINNM